MDADEAVVLAALLLVLLTASRLLLARFLPLPFVPPLTWHFEMLVLVVAGLAGLGAVMHAIARNHRAPLALLPDTKEEGAK